ncbi:DapH/DapD/GlmU-related protein [Microbacterium sp. SCN 69-37]|uniref:DapH/DapD/GlmU-related protein n=1 Tax=Microbacterium sp. SCN 69-37 TaxID=1660115 RepID=UPI00341936AD
MTVGRNVWIASNVVICPGVTIGDNSVIAAGAVVRSSIPAGTLAAGVPARVVRSLSGHQGL